MLSIVIELPKVELSKDEFGKNTLYQISTARSSGLEAFLTISFLITSRSMSTLFLSIRGLRIISESTSKVRGTSEYEELNSEVKLAKGFINGSTLANMETSYDYAGWYSTAELLWPDKVESVEERLSNINKVTASDVHKVARKYLTKDNWHMAAVGNVDQGNIIVNL